ncbi:hypothetical protein HYW76_04795 [Candidatus Pacearchaeota archaeon]|nr:hypothetical protein [Candidatus Pacearchaeota archaeon]
MALKLNSTQEAYREFYGRNTEQMPKLIADGRVPMSVAGLMQRRLDVKTSDADVKTSDADVKTSDADVKTSYIDNYFDSGDAVVYHPDGRVKIVLDSQTLRGITPNSELRNGALVLTEADYNGLQGEEFKKGKLGKVNQGLSRADIKAHPVWKVLGRDQALLNDYTDFIFGEYQARFAKDTPLDDLKLMGVFPISAQGSTHDLRAWCVNRLEGRSFAGGGCHLDVDVGRFLGIAPEALSAPGKGASNIRTYTMADLQNFDGAVKGLEATVRPELLEPFAQLRKKL